MGMSAKKAPRAHEPLPLTGRNVAVIGLGSMGGGMAASLLRAGANVRGYDPSSEALARFSQLGGTAAHRCINIYTSRRLQPLAQRARIGR